jgi:hypothetical protein
MDSNEEEYGFFEDIDNGGVILSYSNQDLPNYNIYTNNSQKKKRDSYDETASDCLLDTYYDYARLVRIKCLYCLQCCYPIIVVGSMISLFGWILYTY